MKSKNKRSEFERWFEAQFGKRSVVLPNCDDAQLRDAIGAGNYADMELTRRQDWDRRRDSALKAWCAKEAKP